MDLELTDVGRVFERPGRRVEALRGCTLAIASGEFACLVGPSGCGKSTVLNLLAGLDRPTSGAVRAGGRTVAGTGPSRVLIFQDAALFPWMTVGANVEFGMKCAGVPRDRRRARVRELLEMVHLERFAGSWVHELSGGMRQRAALARAFAVDPAALLLDEPFGALDAMTRDHLHLELQELWMDTGMTALFVTHNVREAAVLADRVLVMSGAPGRIVSEHRVDLPRPRHMEDPGIMTLARRVLDDLEAGE